MTPNPRFQILDRAQSRPTVILSDRKYWAQYQGELDQWLNQQGGRRTGMLVTDLSPRNLTLFALRWT
jgi:hypothetical protein